MQDLVPFSMPVSLRWADFDFNGHLRHSVYYDFGAAARVQFLDQCGLTLDMMGQHRIGPVLFREEAVFRKEVRWGDELRITLWITRMRKDFSRFTFRHELLKADDSLAAVMHVDGAWIDMDRRKLTGLPDIGIDWAERMPKSLDFEWTE
ncbi:MAG: acyl-CoA thioesterase [Saprospiraceae bacterium]|nr:acyl-CoA thioesterase [Saprospiraceae bacterium]